MLKLEIPATMAKSVLAALGDLPCGRAAYLYVGFAQAVQAATDAAAAPGDGVVTNATKAAPAPEGAETGAA